MGSIWYFYGKLLMMDIKKLTKDVLKEVKQSYNVSFDIFIDIHQGMLSDAQKYVENCNDIFQGWSDIYTDSEVSNIISENLERLRGVADKQKPESYEANFIGKNFGGAGLFGMSKHKQYQGSEMLSIYPNNYFQLLCIIQYLEIRLSELQPLDQLARDEKMKVKYSKSDMVLVYYYLGKVENYDTKEAAYSELALKIGTTHANFKKEYNKYCKQIERLHQTNARRIEKILPLLELDSDALRRAKDELNTAKNRK